MSVHTHTIVGLGEVLWDLLPGGKQLGGAPANFVYMARLLGNRAIVASRVGTDALGTEAARQLTALTLDTSFLQIDRAHPTGTVKVDVDVHGQPQFEITEQVAWDFLEWTSEWETLAKQADAVCFGSLAQRAAQSRETIHAFLHATHPRALRVFDVNLRQAFYSETIIRGGLEPANVIKLNDEELLRVLELLGIPRADEKSSAKRLLDEFHLKMVCVTRGARGSLLVSEDGLDEHPGFRATVADTVGAGDAFTAALVHHYLLGTPLKEINAAANRLGALVASQTGATPPVDMAVLQEVLGGP